MRNKKREKRNFFFLSNLKFCESVVKIKERKKKCKSQFKSNCKRQSEESEGGRRRGESGGEDRRRERRKKGRRKRGGGGGG